VLDTAGSRTLAVYEADYYGSAEHVQGVYQRLRDGLGLSEADLADLAAVVDRDLADARRMQAVVQALREEFRLEADQPDLRDRIHRFFQAFFPGVPVAADEVDLIVTGTLVFLCLPFEGTDLTTPRFAALSPDQQAPIRAFLEDNRRFTQERFGRFPAFGLCGARRVPPELVARLAERAALGPAQMERELGRLVTILPTAEVDKYVVHDVWGHGWQASMLGFEEMYERMARFADPLALDEAAAISTRPTFRSCFRGAGDDLALDEDCLREFIAAELAERLPVALSAALAEMMADVAEFKVIALDPAQAATMPSSSLFKIFPSKLDLTMQDLPFYFNQATKVFRLWAASAKRRQRTVDELVRAGADAQAAARAVAQAARVWEGLASDRFAPVSRPGRMPMAGSR
jgi:hypothetical protein